MSRHVCKLLCLWLLPYSLVGATAYTNPGNAPTPVTLTTGDTFTNNSGLFQSTGTGITNLGTVQIDASSTGSNTIAINGGTITATGTSASTGTNTVPTVPIYGSGTSIPTITLGSGATIANNTTQQNSNDAILFPNSGINFTNNGGTVTGTITASGNGSTLTNTTGTITGAVTLGAASTVTNGGTMSGVLTVGAGSTVTLTGGSLASIAGTSTTLNFSGLANGSIPTTATGLSNLNINSGTGAFTLNPPYAVTSVFKTLSGTDTTLSAAMSGGASTINGGIIRIAGSFLPTGSFTNLAGSTLNVTAATTLPSIVTNAGTINISSSVNVVNNGTLTNSGTISTTSSSPGSLTNSGTMNFTGGALTNLPITNNGIMNISGVMTPLASNFTNNSNAQLYIIGPSGQLSYSGLSGGNSITFGRDSLGNTNSATFTLGGTRTFQQTITVAGGSTLNIGSAISSLGQSFTVEKNATVNFNTGGSVAGAGSYKNYGTTNINATSVTGTINNSMSVTNTGDLYITSGGTYTYGGQAFTNTGNIWVAGTTAAFTINNPLSIGGTLNIGMLANGNTAVTTVSPNSSVTVPVINLYGGSSLVMGSNTCNAALYLRGPAPLATTFSGNGQPGNPNVSGGSLTIGSDSFGNTLSTTSIATLPSISGFPIINVAAGSFTVINAITKLNTGLFISNGATMTVNSAVSGSATSGSNSGTLNIAASFGLTTFSNSSGGVINLQNGATIASGSTINNYSTGTGASQGININTTSTNSGTINNYGTMQLLGTLSGGAGVINNQSGGTLTFGTAGASNANIINNLAGGTFNISATTTNTGNITNTGSMSIFQSFTNGASATITNNSGGVLSLSGGTNNHSITNAAGGTIKINGSFVQNTNDIVNSGTLTVTGTPSGSANIQNTSAGLLTFDGAKNSLSVINSGTFNVISASTNTAAITNHGGTINLYADLAGSATITNQSGATINVANAITLVNAVTNLTGANFNVSNALHIGGSIINSGALTIAAPINITNGSATLASLAGTLTISGKQTLTTANASSYISGGAHNILAGIRSTTDFDQIIASGAVDLSQATVNISVPVTDTGGVGVPFTIIQGSSLIAPSVTPIVTPASTFYRLINVTNTATSVIVTVNAAPVVDAVNQEIAGVLTNMFGNIVNGGQQTLKNAFTSTSRQLNTDLHEMMPIANSFIHDVKMQTAIYSKVQTRLAGLRDGWKHGVHSGIAAGEIAAGNSMWVSTSGSLAEQGKMGEDDGYNAKTGLFLLGRDFLWRNNVVGVAAGYSHTHLKEFSNANFLNNTSRLHALGYGSYSSDNDYWDWLVTTNFNSNHAHRDISVAGVPLTTRADYHSYQIAGKIIRGRGYDFWGSYRYTPFTYLQSAFIHQDAYHESGSAAALSVNAINKNVTTLGLGIKFNFPIDAWHVIGMRELRAAVNYDIINSNNNVTANFIVGSNSFTVTSSPVRLGMQLGAGIAFECAKHLVLEFDYDLELRSRFTDNTGLVKIKFVF